MRLGWASTEVLLRGTLATRYAFACALLGRSLPIEYAPASLSLRGKTLAGAFCFPLFAREELLMKDSGHREQQQYFAVCAGCGCTFVGWVRVGVALKHIDKEVHFCAPCRRLRRVKQGKGAKRG